MYSKNKVSYLIKRSARAKRMRLTIYRDGKIVLTVPNGISNGIAQKFIEDKTDWLLNKLAFFRKNKSLNISNFNDRKQYLENKEQARKLVMSRLEYFKKKYEFDFNRVSIRNQKTRWGSCSEKRNLNFNYRLIHLADRQVDYIIVHELCHLEQMNHSQKFWKLVEEIIPDYLIIRKELRKIRF